MTAKLTEQPFCRWCGNAIRKRTRKVWVRQNETQYDRQTAGEFTGHVYVGDNWPTNKAECQKLSNQQVVSVSYNGPNISGPGAGKVDAFTAWDGESYEDDVLCSGTCAQAMGRSVCRHQGMATKAWREAMRAARAKAVAS